MSNPPAKLPQHVSYRLLVEIAKVAPPENPVEYIQKRLLTYREIKEADDNVLKQITYALNWAKEFSFEETKVELTPEEKKAILALSEKLAGSTCEPDAVQTMIFDTAKSLGLKPAVFFRSLYLVLLGMERGPRLGPYVADAGCGKIAEKLKVAAEA